MMAKDRVIRFLLIVMLLPLFFVACQGRHEQEKKSSVLDKDKMAEVLTDLQLVESIMRISSNEQEINTDSVDYNTEVFKKHEISREVFEESMDYYTHHPDQLEEIYDQVIVKLSERQAGYQGVESK